MSEKKTGLALLRDPFPEHLISMLPKPTCGAEEYKKLPKANCKICGGYHATSKTIHLPYVGHAALTSRLLEADQSWSWEPMAFDDHGLPRFDQSGGLWIKLTVCGVTRPGYGHAKQNSYAEIGSREKEVIGDALRNAAMRFGAALDLWSKADLNQSFVEEEKEQQEEAVTITIAQAAKIKDFLKSDKCSERDLLKWAGVDSVAEIPASKYNLAIAGLSRRVAE